MSFSNAGVTYSWELNLTPQDLDAKKVIQTLSVPLIDTSSKKTRTVIYRVELTGDGKEAIRVRQNLVPRPTSQHEEQHRNIGKPGGAGRIIALRIISLDGTIRYYPNDDDHKLLAGWVLEADADSTYCSQLPITKLVEAVKEQGVRTFRVELHAGPEVDYAVAQITEKGSNRRALQLAEKQWSIMHQQKYGLDTCLMFESGESLWEDSKVLAEHSSEWKSLLDSLSMAESDEEDVNKKGMNLRSRVIGASKVEVKQPTSQHKKKCFCTHHTIQVTETIEGECSFAAYRAIVLWCRTRQIHFGPLVWPCYDYEESVEEGSDEDRPSKRAKTNHRAQPQQSEIDDANVLPSPTAVSDIPAPTVVNPRQVYSICSFLGIEELRKAAFKDLESKISIDNVFEGLFSPLAMEDRRLRRILVAFCMKPGKDAQFTQGLENIRDRMSQDALPISAGAAAELLLDLTLHLSRKSK